MKRLGIVFAAMAALALGASPLIVSAQGKGPNDKQREQGKAEAPAAIAAAKINCTPSDAWLVQSGTDAKTKQKVAIYEVACQEGPGYVIQTSGDTAQAFDCLAQEESAAKQGKGGFTCQLEANKDPKAGFAKLLQPLGKTCAAPTGARVMGATSSGEAFYEIACEGGKGYVIQTAPGKPAVASDCIQTLGGGATECTLTTKATILENMTKLASAGGQPCTATNARMVGSDPNNGSTYYEVACSEGAGFMVQANAQGGFQQKIECGKAQGIGGGCELTVVDETAEAGTYTKLAQDAGYPCDVSKYRYLGKETKSNSEIVELACKNRPDGAIALFPIAGGKAQVFDCVQGGSLGVTCQLSPANAVFAKYTERLAAQGKNQCKVSNAKYLASTTAGSDYIETACSDGLPGYVISVDHTSGQTKELLTCGQATRAGAACTFPTNVAAK
jgi:hypothetical protein